MRIALLFLVLLSISCAQKQERSRSFSKVDISVLYQDSLSIRAIEIMDGSLAFGANKGVFGTVDLNTGRVRSGVQAFDSILPDFRAVAHTASDFFMLSAGNPALLYKTGDSGAMELVYTETGAGVFYDAMRFWNDQEGMAIGDSMNGCLSVLITRDGGHNWTKLPCTILPPALEGEGAFAASNTNVAIAGYKAWIATTASRIFFTPDKGRSWEVMQTPVIHGEETEGIYSIDFYNDKLGFAIGGDYTKAEVNTGNKAITRDGGASWELVAEGMDPGYKSCVQFVPNSGGRAMVALGYTGISFSSDTGASWKMLSPESFYTLRFLNDSVAYAAGKNRIAKLIFK